MLSVIKQNAKWIFASWLLCALAAPLISLAADSGIALTNESFGATVNPISCEITFQGHGMDAVTVSVAQTNLGSIGELETTTTNVSWNFTDRGVHVNAELQGDGLLVHIVSENEGDFTFPILPCGPLAKGWILPMFEGVYAPCEDAQWMTFLTNSGGLNTTADLTLPFIGLDCGEFTLSCIITNAFNNELYFLPSQDGRLQAALTHQFTRNHPVKECAVFFQFGTNSPVEPARLYRQWLVKRGEFVSLAEKIKKTPEVAKLAGAAHIYLWGSAVIDRTDVTSWPAFTRQLKAQGTAPDFSPGKRIWELIHGETRKSVTELSHAEWLDRYNESVIAEDLSRVLLEPSFYDESFWPDGPPDVKDAAMLKTNRANLTPSQIRRINSRLLAAAFPKVFSPSASWGGGLSPKMVQQLARAGFDRLWLGCASWDAFVERPETVESAKKHGFLIGPYDSYNSIHSPRQSETWETAQFDQNLYDTGAIVQVDGSKKRGFKQKGYLLSPVAARPYVEKRVAGLMKIFAANSWFVDCDGFGQFYDDYSEDHPATQESDMKARIARMAWIQDKYGAVIGAEGCSAGVAGAIDFAHGVMTPVIGWGDADMSDKKSKYFMGKYYPPDAPEVFFKPVPIKDEYHRIYFDPQFRLPLFETVFHDSVVATHHWSFPSLKAKDDAGTVELMELLYGVPPLYHMNLEEFQKHEALLQRHYKFFSPLHREIALLPMTEFKWLTQDKLVQETSFGGQVSLVANFSDDNYQWNNQEIPKQSILASWKNSGKTQLYSIPSIPPAPTK